MDTISLIKSRVSIRKYKKIAIPTKILEEIVDCARLAPSGYNGQPWIFVVVTDEDIKVKIANAAYYGRFISSAGACIAVFCKKDAETMLEDACAATENMIIAAQAFELGSCWINSYKKDLSEDIKNILNCPSDYELMTLLSLGYPDQERTTPKKALNEVLKWNSF